MQSFGLLLIGMEVMSDPRWASLGLADRAHLQTVMFLQLVAGGHLLLFVTRAEGWFFRPPYPAAPLFGAIVATQVLAVLMCGFGWLVPAIPWKLIAWVWAYNIAWMFVLGVVRLVAERLIEHRTFARQRSAALVDGAAAATGAGRAAAGAHGLRRNGRDARGLPQEADGRSRARRSGSRTSTRATTASTRARTRPTDDLTKNVARLTKLQELLYAEHKHGLLIVLQGIDAAGKDGTCWHVMTAMNPQGTTVTGFKQPTEAELAHDFLWRVHPHAPGLGQVAVFNRSHYEDVLVVRVHKLVPKAVWSERYDLINDFEQLLAANGTTILKFFLLISPEEQLERFKQRLDDPTQAMEDQRDRLQGARVLGRLRRVPTRTCCAGARPRTRPGT